jgi:hypothetical protein
VEADAALVLMKMLWISSSGRSSSDVGAILMSCSW